MRRALPLLVLATSCGSPEPLTFVAVTFNTGTTEGLAHDSPPDDGYDAQLAAISDEHYGDGLAWRPAVDAVKQFFATTAPDIVGFQETFWSGACPDIPDELHAQFVCETWSAGDPTVALAVLGDGYRVACHPGKPDKCIAVKKSFGTIRGCDADFCLDALAGEGVDDCGRGARVARAIVDLADDTTLEVVNVHGSSGLSDDDVRCRTAQFEQAFANASERSIVLGDLNTDPIRFYDGDESAKTFRDRSQAAGFRFLTEVGEDATPTYGGVVNIDHVLSNFADGTCWFAGDDAHPVVTDAVYFDHRPVVCTATAR